jgi:hypothetical protein
MDSDAYDKLLAMKRAADAGEPLVLIPLDDNGEPTGEPQIYWRSPKNERLN